MVFQSPTTKDIDPDLPLSLPIARIVDEASDIKTFFFSHRLDSKPGQFVLMWIAYLDQKPFSLSYDHGHEFGLTIFERGPFTKKLFSLGVGDLVGISGPYGSAFSVKPNTHYIAVAGGYGAGPLGILAEEAIAQGSTVDFCVGARTKNLLLFEKRLSRLPGLRSHISTDDGSAGHRGYVTEMVEELLRLSHSKNQTGSILLVTCGPERMEKKVLELSNKYNVECEISIERYMKCGYSICGQCCVDPLGIPMCSLGPVVSKQVANRLTEFGQYHRDKTGTRYYF